MIFMHSAVGSIASIAEPEDFECCLEFMATQKRHVVYEPNLIRLNNAVLLPRNLCFFFILELHCSS